MVFQMENQICISKCRLSLHQLRGLLLFKESFHGFIICYHQLTYPQINLLAVGRVQDDLKANYTPSSISSSTTLMVGDTNTICLLLTENFVLVT